MVSCAGYSVTTPDVWCSSSELPFWPYRGVFLVWRLFVSRLILLVFRAWLFSVQYPLYLVTIIISCLNHPGMCIYQPVRWIIQFLNTSDKVFVAWFILQGAKEKVVHSSSSIIRSFPVNQSMNSSSVNGSSDRCDICIITIFHPIFHHCRGILRGYSCPWSNRILSSPVLCRPAAPCKNNPCQSCDNQGTNQSTYLLLCMTGRRGY